MLLTTVPDDLIVYGAMQDNAMLSKEDWVMTGLQSGIRITIKGTNGKSQGVVPFINRKRYSSCM